MLIEFSLFDERSLSLLVEEFRAAMRTLLGDLCDELDGRSLKASHPFPFPFPTGLIRAVGAALQQEAFSNWKVVGWIEDLNDFVYLLDVREQLRREADTQGFADAFYSACKEQFYEHGYLDELFPTDLPHSSGLARRLSRLCGKLAWEIRRESLFLVPGLPCRWIEETARQAWSVPLDWRAHFERGELPGCLPYGLEGGFLAPPAALQPRLSHAERPSSLLIESEGIDVRMDGRRVPLFALEASPQWRWRVMAPCYVGSPLQEHHGITVGPTLVYRKNRAPARVVRSPPDLVGRLGRALDVIHAVWPEGARNLALLTARVVPLRASGVVSFSYRHRPGLSFINCFDRDRFDLIDDLIHENSHHQLNLYLRKATLIHDDRNQEIFYSPWRRSLRPLRAILHATFTFTMGAILFERLSSHGDKPAPRLSEREVLRARARCLEEMASVQYSFEDLDWAAKRGWLTSAGVGLVTGLKREIKRAAKRITPYESQVKRSHFGRELRRHRNELARAADLYRSGRKISD